VGAQASLFDFIHKNKLQDNIYPNISVAYQVYFTMPVSKLKLIKTYLRLTTEQAKLKWIGSGDCLSLSLFDTRGTQRLKSVFIPPYRLIE